MAQIGYSPAPAGPESSDLTGVTLWVRRIADVVNRCVAGKLNATLPVTLLANATSTTVIDPRISAYSALLLTPLTADAAAIAGSAYVGSQQSGQATFIHPATPNTDQLFRLLIVG